MFAFFFGASSKYTLIELSALIEKVNFASFLELAPNKNLLTPNKLRYRKRYGASSRKIKNIMLAPMEVAPIIWSSNFESSYFIYT